jgi:hypothetical protein
MLFELPVREDSGEVDKRLFLRKGGLFGLLKSLAAIARAEF